MKILLFGGSGMVGMELAHALASHTIVAPPHSRVDITDTASVGRVVAEEKPDFIINAAAIIDVGALERDPALGKRVNTDGAANVARAAAGAGIAHLFVSSSYVFGDSPEPYAEDAPAHSTNVYGQTKAEAESIVLSCGGSVVRSSWLYSSYRDTFVDEVAKTLNQGRVFEASAQRGNPTSCVDFASSVVKNFIDSSPKKSAVYHIVSEGGASRYEIAREVARALGVSENLVVAKDFPSSAARPSVMLKNTKLPKLPPWEKSLCAYIAATYRQGRSSSV